MRQTSEIVQVIEQLVDADVLSRARVAAITGVASFEPHGVGAELGHVATGPIETVELRLRPERPRCGLVILTLREGHDLSIELAERSWGRRAEPQPPALKSPLPTPGSGPAAYERWKRRSYRSYAVRGFEVRVCLEDDRVCSAIVDRFTPAR